MTCVNRNKRRADRRDSLAERLIRAIVTYFPRVLLFRLTGEPALGA
jgi:hypothetical protein